MRFTSDRQRRAMFANLASNVRFSKNTSFGSTVSTNLDDEGQVSFSVGDIRERIAMIDRLLKSRDLNDFQKSRLLNERRDLEIDLNSIRFQE